MTAPSGRPGAVDPAGPIPLFATAAKRPRDATDFTCRTLGELFASLHYQVGNGEDIRSALAELAETTANDPLPRSIAEEDAWDEAGEEVRDA